MATSHWIALYICAHSHSLVCY
uniref:Uncharacterized protein n=1 Tax=Anguilla anguilla TaxID=7936 RepID=A0A0E9TKK9_ANGAN